MSFLHSFDGNSARRKRIDLSGRKGRSDVATSTTLSSNGAAMMSKETTTTTTRGNNGREWNLTKEETLARAKEEREQRHRMRMEVKATVVMQKHWRSAKALRRAMEGMREKDENFGRKDGKTGGGVCRECSRRSSECSCALFKHLQRVTFYTSWPVPSSNTRDEEGRMDEDGTRSENRDVQDMETMSKVLRDVLPAWMDEENGETDADARRKIRRRIIAKALRWCLRRLSETRNVEGEIGDGIEDKAAKYIASKRVIAELTCEYLLRYGDASDALIREVARDEARNIKGAVSFNDDIVKHLVRNANTTSIIFEERALFTLISEFGRVALASAGRHEEDAMDVGVSKGDNWGDRLPYKFSLAL